MPALCAEARPLGRLGRSVGPLAAAGEHGVARRVVTARLREIIRQLRIAAERLRVKTGRRGKPTQERLRAKQREIGCLRRRGGSDPARDGVIQPRPQRIELLHEGQFRLGFLLDDRQVFGRTDIFWNEVDGFS